MSWHTHTHTRLVLLGFCCLVVGVGAQDSLPFADDLSLLQQSLEIQQLTEGFRQPLRVSTDGHPQVRWNGNAYRNVRHTEILQLHPGKTGGGTVKHNLLELNASFEQCHPEPCPELALIYSKVLISVRDHVDTFESAFNWRAWLLCQRQAEARNETINDMDDVSKACPTNNESGEEATILHEKYAWNPSNLAEAICDEGMVGDEARQDLGKIEHAKNPLIDWLPAYTLHANLAAMVVEPGFDFDAQIDSVMRWAVDEHVVEPGPSEEVVYRHSSTQSIYRPPPLSRLGQCCMARYLTTSYELLPILTEVACKGDSANMCKAALTSIYTRRQGFIHNAMSCQEIARLL